MRVILLVTILALSAPVLAQEKIFVLLPAVLDPLASAEMDEDVKKECNLQEIVGRHVAEQIKLRNPSAVIIQDPAEAGQSRFVRVRIARDKQVSGIELRRLGVFAEIVEQGNVLSSRYFRDRTTAQPHERLSLCDVMGRLAASIARKAASWAINQERKAKVAD